MKRRQALGMVLAGPAAAWAFGPGDFWNKKPASEWSEDEVKKLMTKSPWAKEAVVSTNVSGGGMRSGGGGGGRGGRGGGMGNMDAGMGGMGGGRERGGFDEGGMGGGRGMGSPEMKMFVRWESAMPMVDARKRKRAPAMDEYYVLSVSGLPMRGAAGRRGGQGGAPAGAMEERLKQGVRLQVKGRDPIAPVQVQRPNPQGGMLLLFFPRWQKRVEVSEKEIVFSVKMEPVEAKVKFSLKDMVYKGELAL